MAEQKERDIFDFSYFASVGYGSDSNVFRSPSEPYIDFANPNLPLIVPEVQTGSYLPYDLGAKYMINTYRFEGFYAAYRASGEYYEDRNQSDADEFRHELRVGNEYVRQKEDRKREVYSAFRFAQRDGVYYDPDDGTPRAINGVDIGDRMNYTRYGPDIRLRQRWGKLAMGVVAKGYLYDYEEVEVVPSYDHEYFFFSLHTQYTFTRTSLLRVTAEKFSRRYSDRPSFDLDGTQPIGNPGVRYDYIALSLLARQRLTRNMWLGFEYERVDREDRYARLQQLRPRPLRVRVPLVARGPLRLRALGLLPQLQLRERICVQQPCATGQDSSRPPGPTPDQLPDNAATQRRAGRAVRRLRIQRFAHPVRPCPLLAGLHLAPGLGPVKTVNGPESRPNRRAILLNLRASWTSPRYSNPSTTRSGRPLPRPPNRRSSSPAPAVARRACSCTARPG